MSNDEPRYREFSMINRPDLVMCRECSTRTRAVAIRRDEIPEHDDWHDDPDHDS